TAARARSPGRLAQVESARIADTEDRLFRLAPRRPEAGPGALERPQPMGRVHGRRHDPAQLAARPPRARTRGLRGGARGGAPEGDEPLETLLATRRGPVSWM